MKGKTGGGRGRKGPSHAIPRPTRRTLLKALSLIIFVVLAGLSFVYLAGRISLLEEPDGDDGEGWALEDHTITVFGDVRWEGLNETMTRSVRIEDGGSLTISGCDLRVPIEYLALNVNSVQGPGPWFSVEPGGTLIVDDSAISVQRDDDLELAVFMGGPLRPYFPEDYYRPSYIARVVNLLGTSRPLLSFDSHPRDRTGTLIVAIQSTPDDDLEVIELVDIQPPEVGRWVHIDVSLEDHAGTIARVVILPMGPALDGIILKDVRVTEDGEDPPMDAFDTGIPMRDGWMCEGTEELISWMRYNEWPDLVGSEGTVEVRGSTFTSPYLPRAVWRNNVEAPFRTLWRTGMGPGNFLYLQRGGDLTAQPGGELRVEGSRLHNVSVIAEDSNVVISGSSLSGDREPVTMFGCDGNIEGTTFVATYGPDPTYSSYIFHTRQRYWGISHWDQRGWAPFHITNCSFEGWYIGVDLVEANAAIEGCVFENISRIAIWDHTSLESVTWEEVNGSNGFIDCPRTLYLVSQGMRLTFTGPDAPDDWGWDYGAPFIDEIEGDPSLPVKILWEMQRGAEVYSPLLVVNATWHEIHVDWFILELPTGTVGTFHQTVSTLNEALTIDFTDREPDPFEGPKIDLDMTYLSVNTISTVGLGRLRLNASVSMYYLVHERELPLATGLELIVLIDGTIVAVDDIGEGSANRYTEHLDFNLSVPTGAHDIDLVLTGEVLGTTGRTEIDRLKLQFVRVDNLTDPESVHESVSNGHSCIVMDPGAVLAIENLTVPSYIEEYAWMFFVLSPGSNLSIRNLTTPENGAYLTSIGEGNLSLSNMVCGLLHAEFTGGVIQLVNISTDDVSITARNTSVTMVDCVSTTYLSLRFYDSSLDVEDSLIHHQVGIRLTMSNASFTRVDMEDDTPWGFSADVLEGSNLRVTQCNLNGVRFMLDCSRMYNGTASFTDCEFDGSELRISTLSEEPGTGDALLENLTIARNRFAGPDACLSGDVNFFETIEDDNELFDGASYNVRYHTIVRLECENQTLADYYHITLHPVSDEILYFLVDPEWYYDELIIRTVLDGLDTLNDPQPVHVVVETFAYYPQLGTIIWFDTIDPVENETTIWFPDWGEMRLLVYDLFDRLDTSTWWSNDE